MSENVIKLMKHSLASHIKSSQAFLINLYVSACVNSTNVMCSRLILSNNFDLFCTASLN